MNQSIELHDSQLASIHFVDGCATIIFSHAYIHKSYGKPGIDSGTGWSQAAELVIQESPEVKLPESWPCMISDGQLELNDLVHANEIPIPLWHEGRVRLKLELLEFNGKFTVIELTGTHPRLRLLGEAEYVEEFAGSS